VIASTNRRTPISEPARRNSRPSGGDLSSSPGAEFRSQPSLKKTIAVEAERNRRGATDVVY
jgi:hypothetical protein